MKKGVERIGRNFSVETATKMCFVKKAFDNRAAARDFAIKQRKTHGQPQTSYKCALCSKFHLTTIAKSGAATTRRKKWRAV